MTNYVLIDGVRQNLEHPDTFDIPSEQHRKLVCVGDCVKLMFATPEGTERMWVQVSQHMGEFYTGTLRNSPIYVNYEFGATVLFHADHIIDIDTEVMPV